MRWNTPARISRGALNIESFLLTANAYCNVRCRAKRTRIAPVTRRLQPRGTKQRWSDAVNKPLDVLNLYRPHDYTLHDAFASRASRDPRRAFISFEDRTWSWQAFDDQVR